MKNYIRYSVNNPLFINIFKLFMMIIKLPSYIIKLFMMIESPEYDIKYRLNVILKYFSILFFIKVNFKQY
jgi:hypothetical protein